MDVSDRVLIFGDRVNLFLFGMGGGGGGGGDSWEKMMEWLILKGPARVNLQRLVSLLLHVPH